MESKVYKMGKHYFKYDYDNAVVRKMWKPSKKELAEMLADNEEWQAKYGKDLWDIDENGMTEITSAGLSRANWENKESRNEYLSMWCGEIEEEAACLAADFIKYELPLYQ